VIEIAYKITLHEPLCVGTGRGIPWLVDSTTCRDHENMPIIPGSTIKGRLRAASRALAARMGWVMCARGCPNTAAAPCHLCAAFGSAAFPCGLRFSPARAASLYYEMKKLADREGWPLPDRLVSTRTGIRKAKTRGVVAHGALFNTECVDPRVELNGTITGEIFGLEHRPAHEVVRPLVLVLGGLQLIRYIGGDKARGFGACDVIVTHAAVEGASLRMEDVLASLEGP